MHISLSGKTALVTGSTQGIGYAIAKGLAQAGAKVFVNGRDEEKTSDAAEQLSQSVDGAGVLLPVAADVGTAEGCKDLVEKTGSVDILVNNVGIFGPEDFFEVEDATWETFLEVNVMSGVRLSRAYLPAMKDKGWGRVVFLSSESAVNIPGEMVHYGVTKAANLATSRGLAKVMAGTGVTVNSVLPGPTLTEGVRTMLADEIDENTSFEEAAAEMARRDRPSTIIRRAATPEEVANMVVYVASEQASATTGAALRVEGGIVESII
ncbi:SDR family NAD(P)-dependent oxidoreductase [Notoacmeibacter ruber]|uniref:SDR family oxidoreductase n=1 Tax=Notoacmeibacter ruber TaxID=2670375 RepID=A0A3L7JBZ0_9HYPH|nr:SDR family oxidoreductase [Notoacmeibacter ruber]RLQ88163.1 SDR family oxidoreductase [Notoacmeibacter ruber]